MIKEEDIITNLREGFTSLPEGIFGIGDDAAVMPAAPGKKYIISKDHMVEDVHFRLNYFNPENLARKALHTNLSDIAAMGAKPLYTLLGIAIPPTLDSEWIDRFSAAFTKECLDKNVVLIGGDTTISHQDLFISVTIIGEASEEHIKFRHGAKPEDIICVAGSLGESYAGLLALEQGILDFQELKNKSLSPMALSAEGIWLGSKLDVSAMMDVSDGLYVDLDRMTKRSGSGARLDLEMLQPSPMLKTACTALKIDPLQCVLAGGEDYALLFTVADNAVDSLEKEFEREFGYSFGKIGVITDIPGIKLMQNGTEVPFRYKTFSHFGDG